MFAILVIITHDHMSVYRALYGCDNPLSYLVVPVSQNEFEDTKG